jgi:DNA polymerase III subunit alpha
VKRFSREQYFKTQAQMEALFADVPSAVHNSDEIAKRCSLSLVLDKPQLPDFATPLREGKPQPMAEYFRNASHTGLEVRL